MNACSIFISWNAIIASIECALFMSPRHVADDMCRFIVKHNFTTKIKA